MPLIPVSHGRGAWLVDMGGKRYLDGISSWWVNLFGHANPRINTALKDQLDQLEHAMLAGFTHEPVIRLSEKIVSSDWRRIRPLLLRFRWCFGDRDRRKMSFHFGAIKVNRTNKIHLPQRQLSRRNRRRFGGDRRSFVP